MEVGSFAWVAHDIIAMVGVSEVVEGLEEEFDCASFSGKDHRHAAFQGAVGSSLGCCCCRCCCCCWCGSWCVSTTTTASASSSATASSASMSGWLCLRLLRSWLLMGLLDLSTSTSSCNSCCCHRCDRGS